MEWKKTFNSIWENCASTDDRSQKDLIIDFISNLLSQQRQELIKEELKRDKSSARASYNNGYNSGLREGSRYTIKELKKKVEGMRELHTHNSIPSYTASLDEGCSTCIRNQAIDDFITILEEGEK